MAFAIIAAAHSGLGAYSDRKTGIQIPDQVRGHAFAEYALALRLVEDGRAVAACGLLGAASGLA